MHDLGERIRVSVREGTRRITRLLATSSRWVLGSDRCGADDGADAASPEPETGADGDLDAVDPDDLNVLGDAIEELGLTPEAFVLRLVEERDGRLRQQAVSERTNWSASTITRLLQDMEERGLIVRVQVGREKLVYLPGDAPAADLSSTREGEDLRTV